MGGQAATVLTPLTQASARLPAPQNIIRTPTVQTTASRPTSKSSSSKSRAPASKDKEKKNNFSSSLRDDDDINDVAAMGGVNLQEESQRILASNAEIVGQQIRSCKDENFLFTTPLHTRINKIGIQLNYNFILLLY
jgi:transcription initiation factor TFIID subunit 4